MMAACRALVLIVLCGLCLAFDSTIDRTAPIVHQAYVDALLENEAALTSGPAAPSGRTGVAGRSPDIFADDPVRLLQLPASGHILILLRNASRIVLCDRTLKVLASAAAPRGAVAIGLIEKDVVIVGGELSGTVQPYQITDNRIRALPPIDLPGVVAVRDLVVVPETGCLFLLDDFSGNLVQVRLPSFGDAPQALPVETRLFPIGVGGLGIDSVRDHLVVNLMLDHTILVIPIVGGVPEVGQASRIVNAGPFWSMDVALSGQTLVIAAGGVENHPLSRQMGEFGYIDSFLYLFRLPKDQHGRFQWRAGDRKHRRRYRAVNLSSHGILTPKAVHFTASDLLSQRLWVTGYGGERAAEFSIGADGVSLTRHIKVMPGVSDGLLSSHAGATALTYTSDLLDRVANVDVDTGRVLNTLAFDEARTSRTATAAHLGELLFFTDLMSPDNSSQGPLSRFTCEACHFEGGVDGRTHFTGREAIYATTKPLHGLANNVPLFSRAGDDTLSSMVMAEFQVANQNRKGFFEIPADRHPWLSTGNRWPETISALELRQALLSFFVHFNPAPNPWREAHPTLDDRARRGLAVFKDRCAKCHQPLVSTRTGHGVDVEQWPDWLTSHDRDLVWGAPFSARTGVRPYVADTGARVPSLRRVWLKRPLFTNGSAQTVREVLHGFRYHNSTVWHHLGDDSAAENAPLSLTDQEIDDLDRLLRYF